MNQMDHVFKDLKAKGQKAFIGFLTAGDPSLAHTEKLIGALEDGGCHIIEVGIPFSDPLADGPMIQAAGTRALANKDFSVQGVMDMMQRVRSKIQVPMVFLVYINTILVYGKARFMADCVTAGISGLVIPDMPLEERDELLEEMQAHNIALIPLVAPTSRDRIEAVVENGGGFTYCVSSLGVTGRGSDFYDGVEGYLTDVQKRSTLPTAVGFGIATPQDVQRLKAYADGVIVGTAIVNTIHASGGDPETVKAFVASLVEAL